MSIAAYLTATLHGNAPPWPAESETFAQQFLQFATQHGIAPLLNHLCAEQQLGEKWPEAVRQPLKAAARQEAIIELLRQQNLSQLLEKMQQQAIHPILLKGAALSHTHYPTTGLRPRCDTDLLIPKEAQPTLFALLREEGYQSLFQANSDYHSSQASFSKKGRGNLTHAYDIHWQISNTTTRFNQRMNYATITQRALPIPELGSNARTLNPADALLLACFHRAGHLAFSGERLIWLYDIHLLASTLTNSEWQTVIDQAKELEIGEILRDALQKSQQWFNTSIAQQRFDALAQLPDQEPSAVLLHQHGITGRRARAFFELKTATRLRDKTRYILQNIFPSVSYMKWRYGIQQGYKLPLYYLYRLALSFRVLIGR